ncbi:hypothetical protein MTO96_007210 [Rhipicephalus appendiculatus]
MKLLAAFVAVSLAVTVCSDLSDARDVKKSQYWRYMRFARIMALRASDENALHVTAINGVTREGNLVTISYAARETRCRKRFFPPNPRRCPPINKAIHYCTGQVEFLGGGFRIPMYHNLTTCAIMEMLPTPRYDD